jgi:hypothetical protein
MKNRAAVAFLLFLALITFLLLWATMCGHDWMSLLRLSD